MARRARDQVATPGVVPPPPLPHWQALLTPVVAHAFEDLRISVAMWIGGDYWYPIHVEPNSIISFESERGVAERRWSYNHRCFSQVQQKRTSFHGEFGGFHDLFVPVQDKLVRAILVAGPVATSRPTSAEVLQRWFDLSHSLGRLSDPSFSEYLASTRSILTLEGPLFGAFERLMACFARLVEGRGAPEALAAEAQRMRLTLREARAADRAWEAVRGMVNERTSRGWYTPDAALGLAAVGLNRVPQHVVVGLLLGWKDEPDPVDELLRRDAFQRACVALARRLGDIVCGQVGDHGVVFLVDHPGTAARARSKIMDLVARTLATAKRFRLKIHLGIAPPAEPGELPVRFYAALWAAEKALSQAVTVVHGEPRPEPSTKQLRGLRGQLGQSVGERASLLLPRFDRYIETILVHSGYRLEPVRAQLDAGIERLAEPLLATGALDEKSFDGLCSALERAAEGANTVTALVSLYRTLVSDIQVAIHNPTVARQERGTRRALAFMSEHAAEPLTLAQVARAAGFAPDYFGRLFSRTEGTTFQRHLCELRVARAKQMLKGTSLSIDGVRRLAGFANRVYFHRAFKQAVGMTPIEYRAQKR